MERSLYLNQLVHFPTDIDDKIYNKTFVGIDFGRECMVDFDWKESGTILDTGIVFQNEYDDYF